MPTEFRTPNAFPVRHRHGRGYEVLVTGHDGWLQCQNESDARLIANAPVLEFLAPPENSLRRRVCRRTGANRGFIGPLPDRVRGAIFPAAR